MTGCHCRIKTSIAIHHSINVFCLHPRLWEGRTKPLPVSSLKWPMCFLRATPNLDLIQCYETLPSAAQGAHDETRANTLSVIFFCLALRLCCRYLLQYHRTKSRQESSVWNSARVIVARDPWAWVNVDVLTCFITLESLLLVGTNILIDIANVRTKFNEHTHRYVNKYRF